ncbi:MAG: two-component system sensor histidine kinase CreC [Opitutaceae bacterium]
MSLRLRLILVLLAVYTVGGYVLIRQALHEIEPRYLEGIEESLVDTSALLASLVEVTTREGSVSDHSLAETVDRAVARGLNADIFGFRKESLGLRFYLTDENGRVLYHSERRDWVGADFSRWNDVHRTLQGAYGARATRDDPDDPATVVLYVASPVRVDGKIAGVLTVGKPTSSVSVFVATARRKIIWGAIIGGFVLLALLLLVAGWVVTPLEKLTAYARRVRDGRKATPPVLPGKTLSGLGRAFDEMREALDGRQYVARTLQTLTHAIKTPLTAIRGAAELLKEPMTEPDREVFLEQILEGTERIRRTVDRMLPLADLESRQELGPAAPVDLESVIRESVDERRPDFNARGIRVIEDLVPGLTVVGDRLLLGEAIGNLLSNSLDFGPAGSRIELHLRREGGDAVVDILDEGPGLPDYALERVFDRFFSLPRPGGGDRSSGLGLSLVSEIAKLHGGVVTLRNREPAGAVARLVLPLDPKR